MKTSNQDKSQDKQIERVLRINYRADNQDSVPIFVKHLDNDPTPATVKGFADRYQNQKLIFLPVIETKEITDHFNVNNRLNVNKDNEDEIYIALNTQYIESVNYDTLPDKEDNDFPFSVKLIIVILLIAILLGINWLIN
jgi:hypothetical protein